MESMIPYLIVLLECTGAVIAAVILGCGAVYCFNRMPAKWFCDYGQDPTPEMTDPYTQRIKSWPWKVVFTIGFVIIGIMLVRDDVRFAVPALCTIWLLLEMAIGDIKYQIVPDQLVVLTAITAVGYIPYYDDWKHCVFGMLIGLGLMGLEALIGKVLYRKETVGGGDIKLFGALGFVFGPYGILIVFVMATVLAAVHFLTLTLRKIVKKGAYLPMVPYITAAAAVYLVFLWGVPEVYITL